MHDLKITTRIKHFERCGFNLNCQADTDNGTNVSNSNSANANQNTKAEELDNNGEWTKLEVAIVIVEVSIVGCNARLLLVSITFLHFKETWLSLQ